MDPGVLCEGKGQQQSIKGVWVCRPKPETNQMKIEQGKKKQRNGEGASSFLILVEKKNPHNATELFFLVD